MEKNLNQLLQMQLMKGNNMYMKARNDFHDVSGTNRIKL